MAVLNLMMILALRGSAETGGQDHGVGVIPDPAYTAPEGIERLNMRGADLRMPSFADTIGGAGKGFRQAMWDRGVALRANAVMNYTENTLDAPVSDAAVSYTGQQAYFRTMVNPIMTYDLRGVGFRRAQLHVSGVLLWVKWQPSGPTSASLSTLYVYKTLLHKRAEVKAGYNINDWEFVGLQVGGTMASAGPGVYAVLPYQLGLSRLPMTAPSVNLKLNGPHLIYLKMAAQRSLDAGGAATTHARNGSGLRFAPKGDKVLGIMEVGYNRPATAVSHQTWLRAGYLRNTTPYTNLRTGATEAGNFCAYLLGDYQVHTSGGERPKRGLYVGASAIVAPAELNRYTRYVELRAYGMGPFQHRGDTVSVVASHTDVSAYTLAALAAAGKSYWRNSSSLTASYNLRAGRGQYLSAGVSFVAGPSVTPRSPNALNFTMNYNLFF